MTVKNEKPSPHEESQAEKTETVDQIKMKYGFSSSNPTSVRVQPPRSLLTTTLGIKFIKC